MSRVCPNCGQGTVCKNCGYEEPDIWMQSRHDFESEVALADNVEMMMPTLWAMLNSTGAGVPYFFGSMVYKFTNPTPNAPPGRVVRIPKAIYKARGNTFTRPKNYTERRDSDSKSKEGYLSAHRIQVVKVRGSQKHERGCGWRKTNMNEQQMYPWLYPPLGMRTYCGHYYCNKCGVLLGFSAALFNIDQWTIDGRFIPATKGLRSDIVRWKGTSLEDSPQHTCSLVVEE